MGVEGYIQGREGVCVKRTRESFHLWPINAEGYLRHKSQGLARLDTSSLLPRIPCPTSHTSVVTHALFQQQLTGRDTLDALFGIPHKIQPKRLR